MNCSVKTYNIILRIFILAFVSCQVESPIPPGPAVGKSIDITFSINTGSKTTRSMTAVNENAIEEVDVLVFKGGFFVEKAQGEDITPVGSPESQIKEFKVTLTGNNASNNTIVIIANAHEVVDKLSLTGNKNSVLNKLVFENTTNDGRWPANLDGGSFFRPIPMWGEVQNVKIDKDLQEDLRNAPISLYRALARVDVNVDSSVGNFQLKSLRFYKYNTEGCIAPGANADWADYPYDTSNPPEQRVRNVTIPEGVQPVEKFLTYDVSLNNPTASVYVLEIDRAAKDDYQNASCLIIGGIYENDVLPTYYRIDFEIVWRIKNGDVGGGNISEKIIVEAGLNEAGSSRTFARLLRNHIYEITITKASKAGASSPEEALFQKKAGIEVKAATWANRRLDIKFE